jgi:16S rRNA pseudouridine516 synthase
MMRLDKYLCETGFGTRSEVKNYLKKGLVTVQGEIVKKPETKIDEHSAKVICNGVQAVYADMEYIMLHKPAGVLSATEDRRQPTVLDLLTDTLRNDLFPVGRLDKDTEGLLLLTNDGDLAHQLLSPKKHVDKTYFAKVQGIVTPEHVQSFREGLEIGEKHPTLPATLEILKSGDESEVLITIHEGKFHQIKRMFEAVGCEVLYLKRLSMGSLKLDESLKPGAYRHLTEEEINELKELTR